MRYLVAFIILSAVVLFHEFGHYILAKKNGVTVLEFALGMGPILFSFEKNGTVYAVKALPFGGSCAMLGEDGDEDLEGSFSSAALWRRAMIVAAGPVFNFILAFLAAVLVIALSGYDPAVITSVQEGSPAAEAGLQEGDRVLRYEGNGIANARELYTDIMMDGVPLDQVDLTVKRDGQKIRIHYAPETKKNYLLGFSYSDMNDQVVITKLIKKGVLRKAGAAVNDAIISINGQPVSSQKELQDYLAAHPLDGSPVDLVLQRGHKEIALDGLVPEITESAVLDFGFSLYREKQTFLSMLRCGAGEVGYWIHVTVKSLASLFNGTFSINDMSGPVGVVRAVGDVYEEVKPEGPMMLFLSMMDMLILITANLGVMNLLPLPALDGGRLLFMLIEAIRRKPVDRELEGRVHLTGLFILLAFIMYITVQDVIKIL